MKLTLEQLRHVAMLARLGLSDQDLEALSGELSSILDYVDQLGQVDTSQISPTAQVGDLADVMRDDKSRPGLSVEQALANASDRDGDFFGVKAMQE